MREIQDELNFKKVLKHTCITKLLTLDISITVSLHYIVDFQKNEQTQLCIHILYIYV